MYSVLLVKARLTISEILSFSGGKDNSSTFQIKRGLNLTVN